MSSRKLWVTSDPHFGHRQCIVGWRGYGDSLDPKTSDPDLVAKAVKEHDDFLISRWNDTVPGKHDVIWVLGDLSLNADHGVECIKKCHGLKHLVLGNHDHGDMRRYIDAFNKIKSVYRVRKFTLSHIPLHLSALGGHQEFGMINLHGHRHVFDGLPASPPGPYYNVNTELHDFRPIRVDEIMELPFIKRMLQEREEAFANGTQHDPIGGSI